MKKGNWVNLKDTTNSPVNLDMCTTIGAYAQKDCFVIRFYRYEDVIKTWSFSDEQRWKKVKKKLKRKMIAL